MKRKALEQHLREHDCWVVREGGNHTLWQSKSALRPEPVGRHQEVAKFLVRKICRNLGVPAPKGE
jgi:mRNA interferase HicA